MIVVCSGGVPTADAAIVQIVRSSDALGREDTAATMCPPTARHSSAEVVLGRVEAAIYVAGQATVARKTLTG